MLRRLLISSIATFGFLLAGGPAAAAGGDYSFVGGDRSARAHVRAALNASTFPWRVVPVPVTIHIARGARPRSAPGDIWLDARLLRSGKFAWGIVQHEYAHQVAFFMFGRTERGRITRLFRARGWCHERRGLAHDDHACERFASALAWAYWPSPDNTERPGRTGRGTLPVRPRTLRALMADLLGPPVTRANRRLATAAGP